MRNVDLHGPEGDLIEAVMAMDHRYFEENPEASEYTREYVAGEFAPYTTADLAPPGPVATVRVRKLGPGVRIRHSYWCRRCLDPSLSSMN